MTFAAPFFLWAAGAVALATVAVHLLAWRRPPASPLPTARFAPERPARVVARAVRPTDLVLLAVRVAVVMLVGTALARPTFIPDRRGTAQVIVVDRSRSAGDGAEVGDSARRIFRPGDAVVVFDSLARGVAAATIDSLTVGASAIGRSLARGSVSAGLIAAVRAAERLLRERDSVDVVIISPLTADELDAATGAIRNRWSGAVRVIRTVRIPAETAAIAPVTVRAAANDAVAAALSLVGSVPGGAMVRLVRDETATADTAWARGGGVLVAWPAAPEPRGWPRRERRDTAFAVVADEESPEVEPTRGGASTVVALFERAVTPPAGRVGARWSDGTPAATETVLGTGCIRSVAVAVPVAGDLALTPSFRRFARRMVEPCGGLANLTRASDSLVARTLPAVASVGGERSVANQPSQSRTPNVVGAWLLGGAIALAIVELFMRKGESYASA